MPIIKYTNNELDLLARLMRAEAIGEGNLGMLMVGNVIVNRAISNCLTFKDTRTIYSVIYQSPGGFAGIRSQLFQATPTNNERKLARRVLDGEYYYPATNALWFYAPSGTNSCVDYWYDQKLTGRYRSHCFYEPYPGICPELH